MSEWPWHWQSQRRQIRVGSDWPLESVVLDNGQGRPQDTTYNMQPYVVWSAVTVCYSSPGADSLHCAGMHWAAAVNRRMFALLCFALLRGTVGHSRAVRVGELRAWLRGARRVATEVRTEHRER